MFSLIYFALLDTFTDSIILKDFNLKSSPLRNSQACIYTNASDFISFYKIYFLDLPWPKAFITRSVTCHRKNK